MTLTYLKTPRHFNITIRGLDARQENLKKRNRVHTILRQSLIDYLQLILVKQ
jgi:hypothetical protein